MLAPLDAGALQDGAVCRVCVEHLALEDSPVLERKIEDIAMCRVRPRIESDNRSFTTDGLHAVSDAAETSMTTE